MPKCAMCGDVVTFWSALHETGFCSDACYEKFVAVPQTLTAVAAGENKCQRSAASNSSQPTLW